jgi:hypothetical protein
MKKRPSNLKKWFDGRAEIFSQKTSKFSTAGSSKPAHSTDTDKAVEEVEQDSVAASAAAAHLHPDGPTPPATPS